MTSQPIDQTRAGSFQARRAADIQNLWQWARANHLSTKLQMLHRRSWLIPTVNILMDWLLIFGAFSLFWIWGKWFLPLTLIVIGNRQRALVVLSHEASHYALFPSKRLNDLVANWFLCHPMGLTLANFRKLHLQHHSNLGDPDRDTDFLHSESDLKKGWLWVYSKQILSRANWVVSGPIGPFIALGPKERVKIVACWMGVLVAGTCLFGGSIALAFVAVWVLARALIHHAIISFVILSDHVGLYANRGVLGFARNHSVTSPLRFLLHPHSNGYHLTHHLLPALPCYRLPEAHRILLGWPAYRNAAHCDSYFVGPRSAVRSWCRRDVSSRNQKEEILRSANA